MMMNYYQATPLGYHNVDPTFDTNWPIDNANAGCDSPESVYSDYSYASAPARSPTPPSSRATNTQKRRTSQPSARKQTRKKRPGYIARPPNAFIIFRSDFWAAEKLKPQPVERNNADISRIVGHCWNSMDAVQKKVYYDRAAQLREMHRLQYPEYRLKPAARRPRGQKMKSGVMIEQEERCRRLASAIIGEAHQLDFSSPSSKSHPCHHEYTRSEVNQMPCPDLDTSFNTSHLAPRAAPPQFAAPIPIRPDGSCLDIPTSLLHLELPLPTLQSTRTTYSDAFSFDHDLKSDSDLTAYPPLPLLDTEFANRQNWETMFASDPYLWQATTEGSTFDIDPFHNLSIIDDCSSTSYSPTGSEEALGGFEPFEYPCYY
ncbi:hypothetical protein DFP72DRAFT_1065237 [Ephemerocybe angulata]|uniref:HMG box domain-containing protein n=1 Tax=Ephemerocybe angulata TaxID=980116 RepID=A0A8H6I4Z2_9AGAR|nr:hypothetical protein DFP72DRAFT_1065237 [Tulosesus angulatus]